MRRALIAVLLAACQGPGAGTSSAFGTTLPPQTSGAGSSGGSSGGSGSTGHVGEDSSAGSASGGATGVALDVGGMPDLGEAGPPGCKGKIDFLFVISRFYLMEEMQKKLLAAYPDFFATIEGEFADFDYHIMVVDGDDEWGLSYCTSECPGPFDECGVTDYPCALIDQVTTCDNLLGAGTVFNAGWLATNKPCAVAGGKRWLDRDQPDLLGTFTCLAQVGTSGDDWVGGAMAAAISPEMNAPGGCNAGFLRDDALLMVVFLSGTVDNKSPGAPKTWAQAVLDAKQGDLDSVVMFSIGNPSCPKQDRICDLLDGYFPHYLIADRLNDDYAEAFAAAAAMVTEVCGDFVPG